MKKIVITNTEAWDGHAYKILEDIVDRILVTVVATEYQRQHLREAIRDQILAYVANYGEDEAES